MTMNLNKIVLTKILDIMPENLKPVTLLMEVLDIGKESAGFLHLSFIGRISVMIKVMPLHSII